MVHYSITYFLLAQTFYATCMGDPNISMVSHNAQLLGLAFYQLRVSEVPAGVLDASRDLSAPALTEASDLEKCDVNLPPREDLYWMHIPKTGTSFKFTIQNVNSNYQLGKYHEPLPKDATDSLISGFATMLRDPAQRLASALTYLGEMSKPQDGWFWTNHNGCGADEVYEKVKEGNTPLNDECLASLTGCETNMLLGRGCMTGNNLNTSDVELAKSRLDMFFFVGLVEEWELSMCLFNFKLTGKRFIEPCQMLDTRPTDTSIPRTDVTHAHVYDVTGYPQDEADEEIYRHGKERFQQEISQNGINKESCARRLEDGVPE